MFEQNGNALRMATGQPGLAARSGAVGPVCRDEAANLSYGVTTDEAEAVRVIARPSSRQAPSAWKLIPRNKAYVETCTFYSQREALAHAEDFDCELVPLFEHPAPAAELHRALAALRDCVEALRPTAGPDSAELRAQREAAYHAAAALLQEVDHG